MFITVSMQSPGEEEAEEETLSPEGTDNEQQDGDKSAEDCGVNVPPAAEVKNKAESCQLFCLCV